MRNSVNIVVSAIVVMALAVLLLAGCQDNYKGLSATPSKNGKELQHHTPIPLGSVNMTTDSSKGDTMTAYIQRIKMEWWRELYGDPGVELDKLRRIVFFFVMCAYVLTCLRRGYE